MQIIFDNEEQELSISQGQNPKFSFDAVIRKEMLYENLEESFMEIKLYEHELIDDIKKNIQSSTDKQNLLKSSTLYSGLKIDLLTLAIAPEHHDIVLLDPKRSHIQKGRINYVISCSHIENIYFMIENANLTLNTLMKNEMALKLKFKDSIHQKETSYTKGITSAIHAKEEITTYEYNPSDEKDNNLHIQSKCSMKDLRNAESVLNIYSTRLVDNNIKNSLKNDDSIIKQKTMFITPSRINRRVSDLSTNIQLVHTYSLIGYAKLNFYQILSENDDLIVKQTSKFFMSMSNKKGGNEKSSESIKYDYNDTKGNQTEEEVKFQVFENIIENYSDDIYYKGNQIGKITMTLKIKHIPLIRQIMCGVMTETGFEINSIFLYDNTLLSNSQGLPSDLVELINMKKTLESAIANRTQLKSLNQTEKDFNSQIVKYLNGIKDILGKSIEESCLYYGYASDIDLYQGQAIMLDLGLNILEMIDKLTMEQRTCCFDILKLIHERSEFDLGTLSLKWFTEIKELGNRTHSEFKDQVLLRNQIIENFLRFNNESMRLCLEGVTRGKNIDNETKTFTYFYLSVAYFRVPKYRDAFTKAILTDINDGEPEEKMLNSTAHSGSISKKNQTKTIDDLLEQDPINNLILWDNLFYKKLSSSLSRTNIENEINEQLTDMDEIISCNQLCNRTTWKDRLSKREIIFFGLVRHLTSFVQSKISSNDADINWLNIPGYDAIISALNHELKTNLVSTYPPQLISLLAIFANNVNIVNSFIFLITHHTNAYDIKAVFNLLSLIDLVFKSFENLATTNKNALYTKFDYFTLQCAFKGVILTDNSLCIAKFIWLYYKDAYLMTSNHINEVCNGILFPNFFTFFFHWSWQVRNAFYYLILYCFGHRIKSKLSANEFERSGNNFMRVNSVKINSMGGYSDNADIFEGKMVIIRALQNIIYTEELDVFCNNKIDEVKFAKALEKINVNLRGNIVISIHHYEQVLKEYTVWKKKNEKSVVSDYPDLEISPPKEDVVEYNTDLYSN